MAELNARIIAKASGTASEEPLAADLEVAELAVNTADGKLFTKHTDGSVVTVSGGGGGAVDSVNGETGVVSLGIQDMDDYAANQGAAPSITAEYVYGDDPNCGNSGILRWYNFIPDEFRLNTEAADVGDYSQLPTSIGADLWVQVESNPIEKITITNTSFQSSNCFRIYSPVPTALTTASNGDRIKFWILDPLSTDIPLADGDLLQWVDADSKFKPTQIEGGPVRVALGIGEYADDAAAGAGGVASGAMYYNTTSSDYRLKA